MSPRSRATAVLASLLYRLDRTLPGSVKNRIPRGARQLATMVARQDRRSVNGLAAKLWGGYSGPARAGLWAIADSPFAPAADRAGALIELLGWYINSEDGSEEASNVAAKLVDVAPIASGNVGLILPRLLFLSRTGRGEQVIAELAGSPRLERDTDIRLVLANCHNPNVSSSGSTERMLGYLNGVLSQYGLAPVAVRASADTPSLDTIGCILDDRSQIEGPLVSVIVPAFNAATTLETALRSLAQQTYRNLDVIVVDDASRDGTGAIAEHFANQDRRFHVIHNAVNMGSYAGRNVALEMAKGSYVTLLDADDWAHPQRVERHMQAMRRSRSPFSISTWLRTTSELVFTGPWRPARRLATENFGSFFFAKDIIQRIGKWDEARVSADREFITRAEQICAMDRGPPVAAGAPLTFGRVHANSLTRSALTHAATAHYGLRREYQEWTKYFLGQMRDGRLSVQDLPSRYASAGPASIRSVAVPPSFDLLVVADWNMRGGSYHSARNLAAAARRAGLRVGIFHYPLFDGVVDRPLAADFRDWLVREQISTVVASERLSAKTVVVSYPALFQVLIDRFPSITLQRLVVLINQMAERDVTGLDRAYEIDTVRRNLRSAFGQEGEWTPISARVRQLMDADQRYPRPSAQTWTPLIDAPTWMATAPHWRGRERARPKLGRHGRDHRLKWPATASALLDAYCADKPCEVYFLGGADSTRVLVRKLPRNWHVLPFGAREVRSFLGELDFFLHFPHETYIEEFGRAPMEAMAIGVPVILPPVFATTFGSAALYADPSDVWTVVSRLWSSEDAWLARVEAGRTFVRDNCQYEVVLERLT